MKQKKEYATPKMKEVKLNAQVVLLEGSASNSGEVGLAPDSSNLDHLA